ncbi:helix-turn-helix domain-containing protein [Kineococcus glutinatus]|uniref:TetR/AcrR family transcriptional regulator n=1 Tax=Kineococcus glutinatus TaxID=1070872 RepID=A0ABP9HUR1_9ACTN
MPGADRPARGARGPYANGERRRAEIVDAAMAVFAEQGYERTSLRDIAERAGTSHASLIHHFGSKAVLLRQVLQRRAELDRPVRAEAVRTAGLLDAAVEMMHRNARVPGLIQLDATLTVEALDPAHPAHEFFRQVYDDFAAEVLPELERERDAGRIRTDLPLPLVARQFVALIQGVQIQWLYDPGVDMAEHVRVWLELLRPARG